MRVANFLAAIKSYQTTFEKEQEYKKAMIALAKKGGDTSFTRGYFEPGHFTASAMIVNPTKTKMLLIFHGKYNIWVQPGGHIDADEMPLNAALREAIEETGITPKSLSNYLFDIDIHPIPASSKEPAHLHHDVRYLFEGDESLALVESTETKGIRWVAIAEIASLNADESVMRMVRKIMPEFGF